ncbi:hypothetical protein ACF3NR_11435 [Vaginella massiliensis]|uniref:hypothetical protein n=1 Tax=Vaginella massiliensis TaxID=1816680 RepID=UPI0037526F6F
MERVETKKAKGGDQKGKDGDQNGKDNKNDDTFIELEEAVVIVKRSNTKQSNITVTVPTYSPPRVVTRPVPIPRATPTVTNPWYYYLFAFFMLQGDTPRDRTVNNDNNEKNESKNGKSTGKNGKHKNQAAKQKAEADYHNAKKEHDNLKSKPNKTKEDKNRLEKLKNRVDHLKRKMDDNGENHSQSGKGW